MVIFIFLFYTKQKKVFKYFFYEFGAQFQILKFSGGGVLGEKYKP